MFYGRHRRYLIEFAFLETRQNIPISILKNKPFTFARYFFFLSLLFPFLWLCLFVFKEINGTGEYKTNKIDGIAFCPEVQGNSFSNERKLNKKNIEGRFAIE